MQSADLREAKRYAAFRHNLAIFEICFTLVFLAMVYFSGISLKFKLFAEAVNSSQVVIVAVYACLLAIFYDLLTFWLDYASGFWLEHKFNLSCQNFSSWLKDYFKKMLIGGVFGLIIIEALYFLMREFPRAWWALASFFWILFSLLFARIFPVFIIPLFYKLEQLKDESLRNKLINLAKSAGIKILDVYTIGLGQKTKKANAALAGVGSSKRILLSDTLLSNYSQDEIEVTLAHELAHYKYRHFWKLIALSLFNTILTFFIVFLVYNNALAGTAKVPVYDVVLFPILFFIFTCLNVIYTPLENAASRYLETQADKEAITLTQKPAAFISLMEKLSRQNLSDPAPSKLVEIFFYNHPPADKRIKIAKNKA